MPRAIDAAAHSAELLIDRAISTAEPVPAPLRIRVEPVAASHAARARLRGCLVRALGCTGDKRLCLRSLRGRHAPALGGCVPASTECLDLVLDGGGVTSDEYGCGRHADFSQL